MLGAGGDEHVSDLAKCPFCGAGITRVDDHTMWTGMRSIIVSAAVRHWCERPEGQPQSYLELKGKTHEDAIQRWNARAVAWPSPTT